VLRLAIAILLAAATTVSVPAQLPAQAPAQNPEKLVPAAPAQAGTPIDKSLRWVRRKSPPPKPPWPNPTGPPLKPNSTPARRPSSRRPRPLRLGYVADAQNRLDDAASLYRRAIAADSQSFEAHLSLGMLLARQANAQPNASDTAAKLTEARGELATSTTLDPGDAGPA